MISLFSFSLVRFLSLSLALSHSKFLSLFSLLLALSGPLCPYRYIPESALASWRCTSWVPFRASSRGGESARGRMEPVEGKAPSHFGAILVSLGSLLASLGLWVHLFGASGSHLKVLPTPYRWKIDAKTINLRKWPTCFWICKYNIQLKVRPLKMESKTKKK